MATFNVTLTGISQAMDFAAGTLGGQWKFTADPGALVVWADLPVAVFNGLAADTYTFTNQRFNDTETVALGPLASVEVVLPQPEAPDPSQDVEIVITDYYNRRGQVRALLWAPVPAALQDEFATPGLVSEWALATVAENEAIEAGEIAERGIWLTRAGKSAAEVRTELETRRAQFYADIQDAEAINQENTAKIGSGLYVKRT